MSRCYRGCQNRKHKMRCSKCRAEESARLLREQIWHMDRDYRRKLHDVLCIYLIGGLYSLYS